MSDRFLYWSLLVGVIIGAALVGKIGYDYRRYRILNDEGRVAQATVLQLKPAHNRRGREGRWTLYYAFRTSADESVNGAVRLWKVEAEQLRVGQKIDVVYAPGNPAMSALNPEQAWAIVLADERVLIPYMAILMVLAWYAFERFRNRNS